MATRPNAVHHRVLAILKEVGAAGISRTDLAATAQTRLSHLGNVMTRLRHEGHPIGMQFQGRTMRYILGVAGHMTRDAVLAAVMGAGPTGIALRELVAATGWQRSAVGGALRAMAAEGLVERTADTGQMVRWGPPGIRATIVKPPPRKRVRRKVEAQTAECWADTLPKQSWVRAADVRITKPGISSVWEMGQ